MNVRFFNPIRGVDEHIEMKPLEEIYCSLIGDLSGLTLTYKNKSDDARGEGFLIIDYEFKFNSSGHITSEVTVFLHCDYNSIIITDHEIDGGIITPMDFRNKLEKIERKNLTVNGSVSNWEKYLDDFAEVFSHNTIEQAGLLLLL